MDIGTELNHYRILGPLGEGGMGQVYRAEDTRLRREVAIKVLPAEVASDPERLARLEREAQLLARLEHPNVAAVYGLEESGTTRFLVMQLVEGETLGDRLAGGALTVEAVVPLALQIAEGLEAAHERGIVHRDLKPANIMVTPERGVRILDFGLAKGLGPEGAPDSSPELTASPTMLAPTQAGMILGTAAYMSPEQARGKAVDKRTDIWAFGCVLYEMLAEAPAFGGETVTDILAGIVHREPDPALLPSGLPWRVRRLLERCLEKDPLRRLRDIGEARIELEKVLREPDEPAPAGVEAETSGLPGWVLPAWIGTAVVAAVATWAMVGGAPPASEAPTSRFSITTDAPLNVFDRKPTLSPDGRRIVYYAGQGLAVRDLSEVQDRRIPGTEEATFPFWSPDSREVGFVSGGRLWRVGAGGGEPVLVTTVDELEGAWWRDDEVIVFADDVGLWEVPARGGDARLVMDIDVVPADEPTQDFNDLHYPAVLPDGSGVLFRFHSEGTVGSIGLWDGERARLILEPTAPAERFDDPLYSPTGHLLYTRAGVSNPGVWAVAFDPASATTSGEPFLVYPGYSLGGIGRDGTILLLDGLLRLGLELVWVDRDGTVGEPFGGELPLHPPMPRIASDGERVVVQWIGDGDDTDLWLLDAGGRRLRVTADAGTETMPDWEPGTGRLAYTHSEPGGEPAIWVRDPTTGESPERLVAGEEPAFTPDGATMIFVRERPDGSGAGLWRLDLAGGGEPSPVFAAPGDYRLPAVSPDGRWLAYVSMSGEAPDIEVRSLPDGGSRRVLSTGNGWMPVWSPDGRELYYLEPGTGLMAVAVETPEFGVPEVAISPTMPGLSALIVGIAVGFDVSPIDGRFLVVGQTGGDATTRMVLVQNWEADLSARR